MQYNIIAVESTIDWEYCCSTISGIKAYYITVQKCLFNEQINNEINQLLGSPI